MNDKDNMYKLQQNEMEHLKTKHDIRHNSLQKEIETLNEQLIQQRKRNVDYEKMMDKERKFFHEERDKLKREHDNTIEDCNRKENNLENLYKEFQLIKLNLETRLKEMNDQSKNNEKL